MITTLIDKTDNVEVIRDQVGMIITTELANQRRLATAANRNVNDWTINVYTERANVWEQVLNSHDNTPVLNIWFDTISYDKAASNISERQRATATYNLDLYGFGISRDAGENNIHGDEDAARTVQRAGRLVRNILLAANNTYLQMQGVVWQRWITSYTQFQPQLDERAAQHVRGARVSLEVLFNEFSPQAQPMNLEALALDIFRRGDGSLIAEADFNYGSP